MVTREQMVEQSVQDYVRAKLFADYSADDVELLDGFPYNRFDKPLDKNYVALAFSFDDGGAGAELGSSLVVKVHTLEFFVFGTSTVWGKNLASAVAQAIERDAVIPLLDISQQAKPQIDTLVLVEERRVTTERVQVRDPRPWEQFIYITRARIQDEYYAAVA